MNYAIPSFLFSDKMRSNKTSTAKFQQRSNIKENKVEESNLFNMKKNLMKQISNGHTLCVKRMAGSSAEAVSRATDLSSIGVETFADQTSFVNRDLKKDTCFLKEEIDDSKSKFQSPIKAAPRKTPAPKFTSPLKKLQPTGKISTVSSATKQNLFGTKKKPVNTTIVQPNMIFIGKQDSNQRLKKSKEDLEQLKKTLTKGGTSEKQKIYSSQIAQLKKTMQKPGLLDQSRKSFLEVVLSGSRQTGVVESKERQSSVDRGQVNRKSVLIRKDSKDLEEYLAKNKYVSAKGVRPVKEANEDEDSADSRGRESKRKLFFSNKHSLPKLRSSREADSILNIDGYRRTHHLLSGDRLIIRESQAECIYNRG